MLDENIAIRDMREMFAWQSRGALRLLYETHQGVESRNLVSLYVALTLKASMTFDSVLLTRNTDIIEYTGLPRDWVPEGLRILERDGLIKMQTIRGKGGMYVGKCITLLPGPACPKEKKEDVKPFMGPPVGNLDEKKKEDIRSRKNMIDRDTWDSLKDIIQYGIDIGAFGTRMPLDTGGCEPVEATKEVKTIIRYIIEISTGDFAHNHGVDVTYDPSNFRQVIKDALDEFVRMKTDPSVWPHDKTTLPTSFSSWLVNPRTGFSWFAKCVKGAVSNAEHYRSYNEQDAVNATPDVTPERMDQILKWWKERNYSIGDKQKIQLRYNLQRVIDVHKRIWEEYGQYYAKTGGWVGWFGGRNPDLFLRRFYEYLSEHGGDPHYGKISPDSMTFDSFLTWIGNEHRFPLNLNESSRQRLIARANPKPREETPPEELQSATDLMNDPFMRRILMGSLADDPRFKDIGRR